jgi:hypothetical protein
VGSKRGRGYLNNMSSGIIGDGFNCRSFSGSGWTIKHETKGIRDTPFLKSGKHRGIKKSERTPKQVGNKKRGTASNKTYLVPLLIIQKEIQSPNHLCLLTEKNILERTRGHKLELVVEKSRLLFDALHFGDKIELALVHFIFHELLGEGEKRREGRRRD